MKTTSHFPNSFIPQGQPKASSSKRARQAALGAFLALGISGCGKEEDTKTSSGAPSNPPIVAPTPTPPIIPIEQVPAQASALIELGPIAGGNVVFQSLGGRVLSSSITTRSDGTISYNPRNIISAMGNDTYVVVHISGGIDTDTDDNGVRDPDGGKQVKGSFDVVIPRSYLESGKTFIANPRAGMISEIALMSGSPITTSLLDNAAKNSGVQDINQDGGISYNDLLSQQMKDAQGISAIVPFTSGYIDSVHSGDHQAKSESLLWNAQRENTIESSIGVNFENTKNYDPVLLLRSSHVQGVILYTLDGSMPSPENSSTRRSSGEVRISMQDSNILYRESYTISGQSVLSSIESFDLSSDFVTLAQELSFASKKPIIAEKIAESYKDQSYEISLDTLYPSDGTAYPVKIDCRVFNFDYGCDYAPYIAYSSEHKDRFISLIRTAIRKDIDAGVFNAKPVDPEKPIDPVKPAPIHYQNEQVTSITKTDYLGGWYSLTYIYNLDGTSDFPVKVSGAYAVPNGGRQANKETLIQSEADLAEAAQNIVNTMKEDIKRVYDSIPRPTYPQNTEIKESAEYRGGSYTLVTIMNVNGDMDYPAKVYASYTLPDGTTQSTIRMTAKNAAELVQIQSERLAQAKSLIDLSIDDLHAMGEIELVQGITYDRGGSYKVEVEYSTTPGKDYPGYVLVEYTLPNGVSDRWTREIENSNDKNTAILMGIEYAQAQITLAIPTEPVKPLPTHFQGEQITHTLRTEYLGGWYSLTHIYNLDGTSDFPVKVSGAYAIPNGGRQENKEGFAHSIEELAEKTAQILRDIIDTIKAVFDSIPKPTYPKNTYLQETGYHRGYSYTLTTIMNINGDMDYPARVYVDYTRPDGQVNRTTASIANDAAELAQIKQYTLADATAIVDRLLDDKYAPSYQEVIQNETYENGGSYRIEFAYSGNFGVDYPGYVLVHVTLPNGMSDSWTMEAEHANQKESFTELGRQWARQQIANATPPPPNHSPNQIIRQLNRTYGAGEYSIYVKYNRVGNGQDYPAFVFGEYSKYKFPGQIFNPPATQREVFTQWEEQQAIQDIESYIQSRLSIGISSTYDVRSNTLTSLASIFENFSLFPATYAACDPNIMSCTPYDPSKTLCELNTKFQPQKFGFTNDIFSLRLSSNCNLIQSRTQLLISGKPRVSVSGSSKQSLELKGLSQEIRDSLNKIEALSNQYSTGSLSTDSLTQIKLEQIRNEKENLYVKIGKYFGFTGGVARGMGKAVYDQASESIGLIGDIASGEAKEQLIRQIGEIKKTLAQYIHNESIDFGAIGNSIDETFGSVGQEIKDALVYLPPALAAMDAVGAGYWTGYIGASVAIEVINPLKKTAILTKGLKVGKWATAVRYIIDSSKAGHDANKAQKIAQALINFAHWSKVDKPDMSRIVHPKLADPVHGIESWYRESGIIGNKSTADAIRYTKITGLPVGDSDHLQKGNDIRKMLERRFNANDLTPYELEVAKKIDADLKSALDE